MALSGIPAAPESQASNHAVIYWLKDQLLQACGCNLSSFSCASTAQVISFLSPMGLISWAGSFSDSWTLVMTWELKAKGRSGAGTFMPHQSGLGTVALIFLWVFCHWPGSVIVSFITGRTWWLMGQQVQCSAIRIVMAKSKWEIGCVLWIFTVWINTGCNMQRSLLSLGRCISFGGFRFTQELYIHLLVIRPAVTCNEIW